MSFRDALPSFLESTVFWLYLGYCSAAVTTFLRTPLLPSSSWDQTLTRFVVTLIVDYAWRRFLSVGHCTDPGVLIVRYAQGAAAISLGDILPVLASCLASGVVVYGITEVVSPISYASWEKSQGVTFCFLFELACDFAHQARNASYFLTESAVLRIATLERELKTLKEGGTTKARGSRAPTQDQPHPEDFEVKPRGVQATASIFIASLVAFGAYFSHGGPMLNISYTVMAALAQRDLTLFLILGTANLLAAYLAGKYVQFNVGPKQRVLEERVEEGRIESKKTR